jgi:uncharacterized protein (TIGR02677 family)
LSAFDHIGNDGTAEPAMVRETAADTGRTLFRYLAVEEWDQYRPIMASFAGTFFSEFTTDEVHMRLVAGGTVLDPATVGDRLESLRRWGNLTVSSATGTPSSLADYYKRRNRYLITRAGQEVHEAVEGILGRVDEVRDVSTGRLRALLDALRALAGVDVASCDPQRLADLVRAVFDPHQAFTSEITQFFAAINQWQSRYDLSSDEFSFFAQVLVGYVTERLDEIERVSRPIAVTLRAMEGDVAVIVERANRGLAARVEEAGLAASVVVTRSAGSSLDDWEHLSGWFVGRGQRRARMDQLRHDAVAAIRTLTLNLTRLSRVGVGASSRRGDLLRLARMVADGPGEQASRLMSAAFGLYPASHWGALGADADDPGTTSSWWDAPPARVPISLRERGDTASRGNASPIPDRSAAQRALRHRREQELTAARRVDTELLALDRLDGSYVSGAALARVQQLLGRALAQIPVGATSIEVVDGSVICVVERVGAVGEGTTVSSAEGTLTVFGLRVSVRPLGAPARSVVAAGGPGRVRGDGPLCGGGRTLGG